MNALLVVLLMMAPGENRGVKPQQRAQGPRPQQRAPAPKRVDAYEHMGPRSKNSMRPAPERGKRDLGPQRPVDGSSRGARNAIPPNQLRHNHPGHAHASHHYAPGHCSRLSNGYYYFGFTPGFGYRYWVPGLMAYRYFAEPLAVAVVEEDVYAADVGIGAPLPPVRYRYYYYPPRRGFLY